MQKNYGFSERTEKDFVNLTLYEENSVFLEKMIPSLNKDIEFEKVSLFEDMKTGTSRIKKMKQ